MATTDDKVMGMLAHHDAEIRTLGGRMTGVESSIRTLNTEVNTGFAALHNTLNALDNKVSRFDSRPQFEFSKVLSLVRDVAFMIGAAVATILYVANGQYGAVIARQEGFNALLQQRIEAVERSKRWDQVEVRRPQ